MFRRRQSRVAPSWRLVVDRRQEGMEGRQRSLVTASGLCAGIAATARLSQPLVIRYRRRARSWPQRLRTRRLPATAAPANRSPYAAHGPPSSPGANRTCRQGRVTLCPARLAAPTGGAHQTDAIRRQPTDRPSPPRNDDKTLLGWRIRHGKRNPPNVSTMPRPNSVPGTGRWR